ncbi:MAG: hypothetical protein RL662_128 [Bacteroidota bacterium]|jgi:hypothetical protein
MKLRSGKELSALPAKLNKHLEELLEDFKMVFSDNPHHAKELLDLISNCTSYDDRFAIRDKIEEAYDPHTLPRGTDGHEQVAGGLSRIVVGYPYYHAIIIAKMEPLYWELFTLENTEAPLLGSVEENNIEME